MDFFSYNLPGYGEKTSEFCGDITSMTYCEDCGSFEPRGYHCNNYNCPECYVYAAAKAGNRIKESLEGIQKAYRDIGKNIGRIIHVVLSVPPSDYDLFDVKTYRKKAIAYGKEIGISGGIVVFHPYRVKERYIQPLIEAHKKAKKEDKTVKGGLWAAVHKNYLGLDSYKDYLDFAPHFHFVGYYPKILYRSDLFEKATGWTYYAIDVWKERNVASTVTYLLTHHSHIPGKNGYVYFGIASPGKISVRIEKETVKKYCPVCDSENFFVVPILPFQFEKLLQGNWKVKKEDLFIHVRVNIKRKIYKVRLLQLEITPQHSDTLNIITS